MLKKFYRKMRYHSILLSAFCFLVSAGCGKKDNPTPPEGDTTPPRVIYAYPADSAGGLPRNTVVYVVFSEAMKQSAAQAAFSASGASGRFYWFGNSLIFVPSSPFPADETISVTVSSSAEDLAGNFLAPALSRWFVTDSTTDDIGPTVSALSPAAGSSGVAPGATITMRTSEPVLQFITGRVRLTDSLGHPVPGNTSWQDPITIAFNPTGDLANNMRYTVTVDTILRDDCWNHNEPASWQFTTEADVTPPTVISVSPANGSSTVSLKDSIMVTFSEPMDTASARAAFSLSPAVPGTFSWGGLTVLKFRPSQILAVKRTYQITINQSARDRNGVQMASAFNSIFTTDRVVYAASPFPNRIYVLARSTGEEMQRIEDAYALRLACSTDGTKLYVLTSGAAGSLRVLDPANGHQQIRNIAIGGNPYAMDVSGTRILVSRRSDNSVILIDTTAWGSPAAYTVDAGPQGVGLGNNRFFAACVNAAKLSAYTLSGVWQQSVTILEGSKMLAMSQGRDTIYLCEGTQLTAFRASDLAWLGTALTDCEDVVRAGDYLYVTDPHSPRVRVYWPTPSGNIIGHVQDITIGAAAKDLCLSADGSRIFSANGSASSVSEINTTTNTVINTFTVASPVEAVAASP